MEKLEQKNVKNKREVFQIVENGIWGPKCATMPTFRIKRYFITKDEFKMYRCLEEIYKGTNIKISTQVALNQIMTGNTKRYFTKKSKENVMEKFKGLSIDFVLFDYMERKILCCIELNGPEHETKQKKIERDTFLKESFDLLNIPLIQIKSRDFYYQEEIKEIIETEISNKKNTIIETKPRSLQTDAQ